MREDRRRHPGAVNRGNPYGPVDGTGLVTTYAAMLDASPRSTGIGVLVVDDDEDTGRSSRSTFVPGCESPSP
jgi:hypothetical protein